MLNSLFKKTEWTGTGNDDFLESLVYCSF